MKPLARTRILFAIGAALMAFGASKLLAQLFLASWDHASAGHADIAARGVWLLAMFLPLLSILSACVAAGLTVLLTRRVGLSFTARMVPAIIGASTGALAIAFAADPTVLFQRFLPGSIYYGVSIAVALGVFAGGLLTVVHLGRTVAPAAA